MNRMMKVAVAAAILATVALAPSMALAAPQQTLATQSSISARFGLFDALLRLVGFGTNVQAIAPQQGAHPIGTPAGGQSAVPPAGTPSVSPEEAIWGGSGKCQYRPC